MADPTYPATRLRVPTCANMSCIIFERIHCEQWYAEKYAFKIDRLIESTEKFSHGIHLCRRIIAFFNVSPVKLARLKYEPSEMFTVYGKHGSVYKWYYVEQVARWWAIRQPVTSCPQSTFVQSLVCNCWMQMIFEVLADTISRKERMCWLIQFILKF